ncbi:DUF898 family protein [Paraflavisolibacter sp. H34]|uniref:YjgN family protein n=1 Tax=Huijunlia imazamoxiresistens TaxID=3127457 RepID=UPI003015C6C2
MNEQRSYELAFHGKGSDYFKISIVNTILCILTLGLYYPWAKAKSLQFLYGNSTFEQTPFVFSGTGKEMFRGFITAVAILVGLYALLVGLVALDQPGLGVLVFYCCFLALVPLSLHGSYRYRMSKTSWRGIRFGYSGNRKELVVLFFKGLLLTVVTFGIYGAWFANNLRRYIVGNIRAGDARFTFSGEGSDFFGLNLKGYILTLLTLGVYSFWWQKDLYAFFVNNLRLEQDDEVIFFRSKATGGGFAGLLIVNMLIVLFTLGLGYAWVVTRTMQFALENVEASGTIVLETLEQVQPEFNNATGDDMADLLDLGTAI